MRLTVVGAGRVGLTTALALEHLGHDVICVDLSRDVVESLCRRKMPFHDPDLERLLPSSRIQVFRELTDDTASAEVVMIAVQTPGLADGHADLSAVFAVAQGVAGLVGDGADVALAVKSTTPPGTAAKVQEFVDSALAKRGVEATVRVVSNPEFLRQGSALTDTLYPDRVVVGVDDDTAHERMHELYVSIVEQSFAAPAGLERPPNVDVTWVRTAPVNAELIKYGSNAFLATKLTFVNEIARLARSLGGDIRDVVEGIGLDPRIGSQYMQPGPGYGGPCLGKDTRALAAVGADFGEETPLLEAVSKSNALQRRHIVDQLEGALGSLDGTTIGLLGLSFKARTDDVTDSPALDVAAILLERGAIVRAYDPAAEERAKTLHPDLAIEYNERPDEMSDGCDAMVLMTDWPEFRDLDWNNLARRVKRSLVVDARNWLDQRAVEAAGFQYLGLGR